MRDTPEVVLSLGVVESPIGAILVACRDEILCAVEFADHKGRMITGLRARFGDYGIREAADPGGVCTRLQSYLRGRLDAVADIAVDGGGTPFQRRVWAELRRIAPGNVLTYGALARKLGMPKSPRAVGHANSVNPINIVVRCHRVIGADGALTGYSGGLERKRWLLRHEGVATRQMSAMPNKLSAIPQRA